MKIKLAEIDVTYYKNSRQRTDMGQYHELKASLLGAGENFNPVLVAPHPDAEKAKKTPFALFDGWGRYGCAADLGWKELNAEVKTGLTPEQIEDFGFVSNVQRRALTPAEIADYIGARSVDDPETGRKAASIDALAKRLGLAKSSVENYVRVYKAPFYKGWHSASVQNKPAPALHACITLLSEHPAKNFEKGEEGEKKRNEKLVAEYGKLSSRADAAAQAKSANGGKNGRAKNGSGAEPQKPKRQSATFIHGALKIGRGILKDIETGKADKTWKPSDVPILEQTVATLEWCAKKKGAKLPFEVG